MSKTGYGNINFTQRSNYAWAMLYMYPLIYKYVGTWKISPKMELCWFKIQEPLRMKLSQKISTQLWFVGKNTSPCINIQNFSTGRNSKTNYISGEKNEQLHNSRQKPKLTLKYQEEEQSLLASNYSAWCCQDTAKTEITALSITFSNSDAETVNFILFPFLS